MDVKFHLSAQNGSVKSKGCLKKGECYRIISAGDIFFPGRGSCWAQTKHCICNKTTPNGGILFPTANWDSSGFYFWGSIAAAPQEQQPRFNYTCPLLRPLPSHPPPETQPFPEVTNAALGPRKRRAPFCCQRHGILNAHLQNKEP